MNGKQFVWCWMLMCCACVLFDAASGSNKKFTGLHPPSWTLSEIVTPVRLEHGDVHKGERHFQKRSATLPEQHEARNSEQSTQYRVEAFGEEFILDLNHDISFLSPSFNVHVSGEANLDIHDEDNSIHCFYAGHVNGHSESSAVVSLCGGMVSIYVGIRCLTNVQ
nr:A disintegrin and metalloproteinase with thrombospondin motifs 20-like [Lytechinus pictus]